MAGLISVAAGSPPALALSSMPVLSVDLAFRRWCDVGIVVMERPNPARSAVRALTRLEALAQFQGREDGLPAADPIQCEIVAWDDAGPVDANVLAGRLNHLCGARG